MEIYLPYKEEDDADGDDHDYFAFKGLNTTLKGHGVMTYACIPKLPNHRTITEYTGDNLAWRLALDAWRLALGD